MQYYALVEDWPGESILFFREMPGCFSAAPTFEDALKNAPTAISAYLNWLKKNDIPIVEDDGSDISVVVKERLAAIDGNKGPRFEGDLRPPDDTEIDKALNVAAVARTELLELYEDVPEDDCERALHPGDWSLAQHMAHIVKTEAWYASRLMDNPPANPGPDLQSDIAMALFDNAMDVELLLHDLTAEQRTRVYLHDGEEWTAAKVLRRMTQHLREHYPWMREIARSLKRGTAI
ncbi:MAG TPA: DinB family protein [Ktedonobacteraceae bacterium]|jgi:predicted RNase H-like HicB family nuclease|nr:DinB family protein [Ktedonobacteraceae bacterium]